MNNFMWRDRQERMWVGDININDPYYAASMPFKWRINNKRATRKEIYTEWAAVRRNGLGLNVDIDYFDKYANLYLPVKYLATV